MANLDNPNGFKVAYTLSGGPPARIWYPIAASQTLHKGDMVYLSSGQVTIATSSTTSLLGVIDQDCSGLPANTLVPVLVGDGNTVFEGQCSGSSSYALLGTAVGIEGTTGQMEVDEDGTTGVIQIIQLHPEDEIGANGRVRFLIRKSQFHGLA